MMYLLYASLFALSHGSGGFWSGKNLKDLGIRTQRDDQGFDMWTDHLDHAYGNDFGTFQTYVRSNSDGRPEAVGVNIPSKLEDVFPSTDENSSAGRFKFDVAHPCQEYVPFKHIQLNYNPKGHLGGWGKARLEDALKNDKVGELIEKNSIYYVRHIDFHFHIDSIEQNEAIKCSNGFPPCQGTEEEMKEFKKPPPEGYVPDAFYLDPILFVPGMGAHWDMVRGDRTEKDFDSNLFPLWVTYDGRITAWDVMLSLEDLATSKGEKVYDWAQPEKYLASGYYPTKLRIIIGTEHGSFNNEDTIRVEFTDMVWRNAEGDDLKEEDACPAIDCSEKNSLRKKQRASYSRFCSACGIHQTKFIGRKSSSHSAETSCDCEKKCVLDKKAVGFTFREMKEGKNSSNCYCLKKISKSVKGKSQFTGMRF